MKLPSSQRRQYLQEKHSLRNYHFEAFDALQDATNLRGKCILEIGGSNMPREMLTEDFQVQHWISVDMIDETHYARKRQVDHYHLEKIYPLADAEQHLFRDVYSIFNGPAENLDACFDEKFDIVFSLAAFEHIGRLSKVLRKIYHALKPGGILFSYFGPIFSCRVGHHCWINADLNFNKLGQIPEFGHLLMKPAELLLYLIPHYPREIAEEIVYQFYCSERINRNLYEDYEHYMAASPFKQFECRPYAVEPVDSRTQMQLERMRPGYSQFSAYGMQIIARK